MFNLLGAFDSNYNERFLFACLPIDREKEDEEFQLGTHFCGGTILNERFVLTAAHCQTNILSGVGWGSFLPDVFVRGRIRVKRFIIHPKYRPELNAPYDVALVELEEPLPLDDWLQPACVLVQRNDLLLRHHQITAIGHGFTEPLVRLRNEQGSHVELSRRNSFNLKSVFMFRTPDNRAMCQNDVLCVRAMKAGEQVCAGDSGSPVHLDLKGFTLVIGVVSGSSWTLNNWNQIDYTCLESTSVNLVSTHLEFISEHVKDFCKIAF